MRPHRSRIERSRWKLGTMEIVAKARRESMSDMGWKVPSLQRPKACNSKNAQTVKIDSRSRASISQLPITPQRLRMILKP
jgi:hypothetical protein